MRDLPVVLVLQAGADPMRRVGVDRPALYRLKLLLKGLLRQAGWVVVECRDQVPTTIVYPGGEYI